MLRWCKILRVGACSGLREERRRGEERKEVGVELGGVLDFKSRKGRTRQYVIFVVIPSR